MQNRSLRTHDAYQSWHFVATYCANNDAVPEHNVSNRLIQVDLACALFVDALATAAFTYALCVAHARVHLCGTQASDVGKLY